MVETFLVIQHCNLIQLKPNNYASRTAYVNLINHKARSTNFEKNVLMHSFKQKRV